MSSIAENKKTRAPRNRTLSLTAGDRARLSPKLLTQVPAKPFHRVPDAIACGGFSQWVHVLPKHSVDLLFLDPPYNLSKSFNGHKFAQRDEDEYTAWLDDVIRRLVPSLKATATIYICGDWRTSHSIFEVAAKYFIIQNRITWEREKGRGAKTNWKNSCEDIWFCTVSENFHFDVEAVKLRRKVLAPYTHADGVPKDWVKTEKGNFRDTYPSNLWTDISIPFWSMPENTDHPTQKSEKLVAKLLLASTKPDDQVLDPFLGSGTTAVVARKLGRRCFGIEQDREYCLWALRRGEIAETDATIQGFADGVFWERNTLSLQLGTAKRRKDDGPSLFS